MNIQIKKVEKGMGQTFADYFANLDFGHEPHWAGCFCRFYHLDTDLADWQSRSAELNRSEAINEIDSGNMTGFLAFDEDKCIGWLNANHWKSYKRLHQYITPVCEGKNVGVVICYVIHPEYRSMGVAKKLLQSAVDDFKAQDYDAVLALPLDVEFSPKSYRGTMSMYEQLGFKKTNQYDEVCVYWVELK